MASPIRNLAVLRDAATDRYERIISHPRLDATADTPREAAGGRIAEQIVSISEAMMSETPVTLDDVLSLLIVMEDAFDSYRTVEPEGWQRASFERRMEAGLVACAIAVGRLAPREDEITNAEHAALTRMHRKRAFDDPPSRDAWKAAYDAYLAAKAAEDGGSDDDPDADDLTNKRCAAEDVLMVIPAPDVDALAVKHAIAVSDRRFQAWNDALDADALRLAGGRR